MLSKGNNYLHLKYKIAIFVTEKNKPPSFKQQTI